MSSVSAWSTKAQVLETLSRLSGGRQRLLKLDNDFVVEGDGPPPVILDKEDDEMHLQFGDDILSRKDLLSENTAPDLQGITHLLRLVEKSDRENNFEDLTPLGQPSNCVISIRKGTKLNPDVKEFIPQSASSCNSSSDISENRLKNEKTDSATNTNKMIDSVTEDLATKLKNEISDASKSDTFELKKQKNVAIATLLRLYANKQTPSSSKQTETVKLISPDYFENACRPSSTKSERNVSSLPSISTSPNPKSMTSRSRPNSSNDVKFMDPAIRTSINKVNEWLGEKPVSSNAPRKSPAVFLGPITYKSKEPPATKAPSIPDTNQEKEPVQHMPNEYKPTIYAEDYNNQYMERSKSKKNRQNKNRNMWTDLHEVLKEKENMAKKKLERQSDNCSDSDTGY